MKQKKFIKISLSTTLLIVAILAIIVLCIYIFILSSKLDTISNQNENNTLDTETATLIPTISKIPKNRYTLPQLAGKFSDITSIIKEYIDFENVKNYKDFNYDLDSDGTIDKITLKYIVVNGNDYGNYSLEYNGKTFFTPSSDGSMNLAGIVDLDYTDKYLDIWVYDPGPSSDPVYHFYRKVGNQIIEMGSFAIDQDFFCDGEGKVLSANRYMPETNPQVFNYYYTIENNVFKEHSLDFSYNKNYEYTSSYGLFTTNLENLKMFEKSGWGGDYETLEKTLERYNIYILDENTSFKIIEFVEKDHEDYTGIDLKVTLSDGTTGYLIHAYCRIDCPD